LLLKFSLNADFRKRLGAGFAPNPKKLPIRKITKRKINIDRMLLFTDMEFSVVIRYGI
jgi:hypothetical protein